MSYEVEPIDSSVQSAPLSAPREDRVIQTYGGKGRLEAAQARVASAQGNMSEGSTEDASGSSSGTGDPQAEVKLSPKAAILARREQQFRKQQQAIRAKEAELEAKLAKVARFEALESKLAAKDYSALDEMVDYGEFSQYQLSKANSSDPRSEEVKALKDKIEKIEKSSEETLALQFEAAVTERRNAVKSLVSSNEEYSSIKELGQEEAVVQHILDTWEHDSIELDPEQAAKEVEDLLLERASKWSSLSKLKKKSPEDPAQKPLPPMKQQGVKTLTNQITTSGPSKAQRPAFHHMSEAERYAEARRRAVERLEQQRK
jgi:hypothetical protein